MSSLPWTAHSVNCQEVEREKYVELGERKEDKSVYSVN